MSDGPDMSGLEGRITPPEAADMLGVAPRTLADWRSRGVGPTYIRLGNGRVIYTRAQVKDFGRRWKRAPELTSRMDKPVLQRRLDERKAKIETLEGDKARLVEELATLRGELKGVQAQLVQTQADGDSLRKTALSWKHRAEQFKGQLREQTASLEDKERALDQREQLPQVFFESNQDLQARYEREVQAGRVVALTKLEQAADFESSTKRSIQDRLIVLYTGRVKKLGGGSEPLDGRKPSKAISDNHPLGMFFNMLAKK